ncbi:MAG: hypothetical protein KF760_32260 [Candidatus Eremiobacteraeota bacterium]|nr:hypothetical protein [Candidatus Eremiobacteraeota bacterium]MCW5870791.1 hypothetical protein [Candidatus Eremiobacteraeota bacterium]
MDELKEFASSMDPGKFDCEQTFPDRALYGKWQESWEESRRWAPLVDSPRYVMFVDETGCTGTRLKDDGPAGSDWLVTYAALIEESRVEAAGKKLRALARDFSLFEPKARTIYKFHRSKRDAFLRRFYRILTDEFEQAYVYAQSKLGLYKEKYLVQEKLHPDSGHRDLGFIEELEFFSKKGGDEVVADSATFLASALCSFCAARNSFGRCQWDPMNVPSRNDAIRKGFEDGIGASGLPESDNKVKLDLSQTSAECPLLWVADFCAYEVGRRLADPDFPVTPASELLPEYVLHKKGRWVGSIFIDGNVGQVNLMTRRLEVINPI